MEEIFEMLQQQRETILNMSEAISGMVSAIGQQDNGDDTSSRKTRLVQESSSSPNERCKGKKDGKVGRSTETMEALKTHDNRELKMNDVIANDLLDDMGFDSDFGNNGF